MVTVVITTCQREADIVKRAIKSVIYQTYNNWELIVVDDSPDDYLQRPIIRDFCLSLSNSYDIVYFANEKNKGACFSRNLGLEAANGNYIAYLDDDDEWLPSKLEIQVNSLDKTSSEYALVYGPLYNVNDETNEKILVNLPIRFGYMFDELMNEGNFIGGMSVPMMRTESVKLVGGFDVLMQSAQDFDLWLRLAKDYMFISVETPLVICHIHKGEQISRNIEKKISGLQRLCYKNKDYLEKHREVYWKRTVSIIPYYIAANMKKKAILSWFRSVSLCPEKIGTNLKELARIIIR